MEFHCGGQTVRHPPHPISSHQRLVSLTGQLASTENSFSASRHSCQAFLLRLSRLFEFLKLLRPMHARQKLTGNQWIDFDPHDWNPHCTPLELSVLCGVFGRFRPCVQTRPAVRSISGPFRRKTLSALAALASLTRLDFLQQLR